MWIWKKKSVVKEPIKLIKVQMWNKEIEVPERINGVLFHGGENKQGVCHTHEECQKLFEVISENKKKPVKKLFLKEYAEVLPKIREVVAADPKDWYVGYHHGWGMGFRNWLRQNGYGEDYWPVHNLDCIYVNLIEDFLTD